MIVIKILYNIDIFVSNEHNFGIFDELNKVEKKNKYVYLSSDTNK